MRPTGKRKSLPSVGSEGTGPMSITYFALRRSSFPIWIPFLVELDADGLRDLHVLVHLAAQHVGELLRRLARDRLGAVRIHRGLELRRGDDRDDLAVQLVDHGPGHVGRTPDTEPEG